MRGFDVTRVDAVLFDMDGVLIDSYEAWFHLLNAAAAALGHPSVPREAFDATWGQGVQADAKRFFPGHAVEEIAAYYDAHFIDHVEHVRIHPEAKRILHTLRETGHRTAVVTNTPTVTARATLERARLRPDTLVGETDAPAPKPAPDMLEEALRRLDVPRHRAVFVGDSRYDREAARAANVAFAGLGIEGRVTLTDLAEILELIDAAS